MHFYLLILISVLPFSSFIDIFIHFLKELDIIDCQLEFTRHLYMFLMLFTLWSNVHVLSNTETSMLLIRLFVGSY